MLNVVIQTQVWTAVVQRDCSPIISVELWRTGQVECTFMCEAYKQYVLNLITNILLRTLGLII